MAKKQKSSGISFLFRILLLLFIGWVGFKVANIAYSYLATGAILAGIGLTGLMLMAAGVGMIGIFGFVVFKLLGGGGKKSSSKRRRR